MKRNIFFGILALALCLSAAAGNPKNRLCTVTYRSSVECEQCRKKVEANIAFEKGVKDLQVDLSAQTIRITFDTAKTDTATLGSAIRRLGYSAKVCEE